MNQHNFFIKLFIGHETTCNPPPSKGSPAPFFATRNPPTYFRSFIRV